MKKWALLNVAMKWDVGPRPHIPFHSYIQQREKAIGLTLKFL